MLKILKNNFSLNNSNFKFFTNLKKIGIPKNLKIGKNLKFRNLKKSGSKKIWKLKKIGIPKNSKLQNFIFFEQIFKLDTFYFHRGFLYNGIFYFIAKNVNFIIYWDFLYENKNLKNKVFEFFMYKHT